MKRALTIVLGVVVGLAAVWAALMGLDQWRARDAQKLADACDNALVASGFVPPESATQADAEAEPRCVEMARAQFWPVSGLCFEVLESALCTKRNCSWCGCAHGLASDITELRVCEAVFPPRLAWR